MPSSKQTGEDQPRPLPAQHASGAHLASAALAAFWDVLIPGRPGEWPSASDAIEDQQDALSTLEASDRAWLQTEAAAMMDAAPGTRPALMRRLQRECPDRFARIVAGLYAAYYTSRGVHEVIGRLAEAGPRESLPGFDSGLLDHVRRTQAGRRRL